MIRKLTFATVLLTRAAFAQDETVPPPPVPPPPAKVVFTLTMEQLQVIGKAVSKLPYEEAAPVIAELQKQLSEQQQKPASFKHK